MQKPKPILLFNDECSVCRHIGQWVQRSAKGESGETSVVVQPIGDDPELLRSLNPELDIWDAYATIHILMPDGSMKVGGEAVAEVLQGLPNCKWFSGLFARSVFGFRPFQTALNVGYAILADVRPLFGCESCGIPVWLRPLQRIAKWVRCLSGTHHHSTLIPHFTSLDSKGAPFLAISGEQPPRSRRL